MSANRCSNSCEPDEPTDATSELLDVAGGDLEAIGRAIAAIGRQLAIREAEQVMRRTWGERAGRKS